MMKRIIPFSLLILLFISCGTSKSTNYNNFTQLDSPEKLNGTYINRTHFDENGEKLKYNQSLLSLFNIHYQDQVNWVTLKMESPKKIRLTYQNDSAVIDTCFSGKMKDDFFEVYLEKRRLFTLVFNSFITDKVRIGKAKDEELLVNKYENVFGNLLFFMGGHSYDRTLRFQPEENYSDLSPVEIDGKWGYQDSSGIVCITPAYDFCAIFEEKIARAKRGDKWGLINRQGKELCAFKYDKINPFDIDESTTRIYVNEKVGFLNRYGIETVPPVYDNISSYFSDGITIAQSGNLYGFVTTSRVVTPPIYSKVYSFINGYAEVIKNGTTLYIDRNGKEYAAEATGSLFSNKQRGPAVRKDLLPLPRK